ncbi:hypothetical protein BGZ61DRAFT_76180 [Ilyonectria robusta]|uniref:uncharacterized protein n=1 Tax=Ilyonectria robusta TaxID=1079257 RepID=UPI001E8D8C26|nr:uncharacterized protein BGZ61DRAFT_76180 [Ilyonectria robusta]KAH8677197.1 hypothetical protein BGZ61DRAFT_76180 [Ilyonectria robusta]
MPTLISIAGWREWWRLSGPRLSSLPLALLLPPSFSGRHEMHTEHCTLPSARSMLRHSSSSPQALRDEYGLFQLTSLLHLAVLNSLRTRPPPPSDSLVHPRRLFAPKMPPLWSTTVRPAELSPSPVVGTCSEERSMPRRDLFKAPTRGNRPKQTLVGRALLRCGSAEPPSHAHGARLRRFCLESDWFCVRWDYSLAGIINQCGNAEVYYFSTATFQELPALVRSVRPGLCMELAHTCCRCPTLHSPDHRPRPTH